MALGGGCRSGTDGQLRYTTATATAGAPEGHCVRDTSTGYAKACA
ncbi:MAG: hypothetical protein NT071_11985 [Burkholderiales bacterium]|nr:hypothetical protein [Burkholderiales bacterium]